MLKHKDRADRGDNEKYENKDPITDKWEVLDLLQGDHKDSNEGRYIYTNTAVPEICVGWFRDGDSGGASSGTYHFLIDPPLIADLKEKHLVTAKLEPVWGRTIIHDHRLVLSEEGKKEIRNYLDKQRTAAIKLRQRRKGRYIITDSGRENWQFGALFFEFRNEDTLMRSRVYPESGKIVRVR